MRSRTCYGGSPCLSSLVGFEPSSPARGAERHSSMRSRPDSHLPTSEQPIPPISAAHDPISTQSRANINIFPTGARKTQYAPSALHTRHEAVADRCGAPGGDPNGTVRRSSTSQYTIAHTNDVAITLRCVPRYRIVKSCVGHNVPKSDIGYSCFRRLRLTRRLHTVSLLRLAHTYKSAP